MPEVEFDGKSFSIDEDGFIDNFESWCPEWVQLVKKVNIRYVKLDGIEYNLQ